ncbi:MAG TPA: PKD domain-containing protein [Patescibacteria group bacterium]|nr:PKD domain-containing protein [Patescibacteria group bacterium]
MPFEIQPSFVLIILVFLMLLNFLWKIVKITRFPRGNLIVFLLILVSFSSFMAFGLSEQPQQVQAAAKTWDGEGTDGTCGGGAGDGNKWSCALNWDNDALPVPADTVTFNSTSTKDVTIDAAVTVAGFTIAATYSGTITSSAGANLAINGNYSQSAGTFSPGSTTITVSGHFFISAGTFTAGTSTLIMTGDYRGLAAEGKTLNNLTISGIVGINTNLSIAGTGILTVDAAKSIYISEYYTLSMLSGATTTINGTIDGIGTLELIDGSGVNLSAGGTLRSITRFTTSTSNTTIPDRAYGSDLELYNNTGSGYSGIMEAGTTTINDNLYLYANGAGNITLDAVTNDPDVDIEGSFDYIGTGAGLEDASLGDGNWNIAGSISLAGGTLTDDASSVYSDGGEVVEAMGVTLGSSVINIIKYNGDLIAAGDFTNIGGDPNADYIVRWNGANWVAMGSGLNNEAVDLLVYNGYLIVTGYFTTAGGVTVNGITKWDGASWTAIGTGISGSQGYALGVYNGKMILGGEFTSVSGVSANRIISWDGITWTALGTGLTGGPFGGNWVNDLTIYNSGLVVGGQFGTAGGVTANKIANWNGSTWSTFGSGIGNQYSSVATVEVYHGNLYAGGGFRTAGGLTVNGIAKWNGAAWSALPGGGTPNYVFAFFVYQGKLLVGGNFNLIGGVAATRTAFWDDSSWSTAINMDETSSSVGNFIGYNGKIVIVGDLDKTYNGTIIRQLITWRENSVTVNGQTLNNLEITNTSAAGVAFKDSATIAGTFTVDTASVILNFNAGSTYTVNNITLNGQAGTSRINLSSSSAGTDWNLNVSGAQTINYVEVSDSDASGGSTIDADDGTNRDRGGNTNWDFDDSEDRYWVGAAPAGWNNTANWSDISGGLGGHSIPYRANSVYFDNGGAGSITINDDTDIEVAKLTIEATFPGGSTFDADNVEITCNGDFSVFGGTFNAGTSTLIMDATAANSNLITNGYTLSSVEFHLDNTAAANRTIILGSGPGETLAFSGNFTLDNNDDNNLIVDSASNDPTINIIGSISVSGTGAGSDSLQMGDGTWTVSGNADLYGGSITANSSTLVMNGSNKNIIGGSNTLHNLTISGVIGLDGSLNVDATGTLTVDNTKTLQISPSVTLSMLSGATTTINGTIDGPGTLELIDGAGANLSTSNTLRAKTRFTTSTSNITIPARTYGSDLELYNNTGSSYSGIVNAGSISITGNLNISANSTGSLTLNAATNDPNFDIEGSLDYTGIGDGSESISMGDGSWNIAGYTDFTGGTLTQDDSEVIMDGSTNAWSGFGVGTSGEYPYVLSMTNYNGKLIIGGGFTTIDGVPANYIAQWDGTNWTALGTGMDSYVRALTTYQGYLVAAGSFYTAGGVAVNQIAKWDGANWSAMGEGLTGTNSEVDALCVYRDKLYVSGDSFTIDGQTDNSIAEWDGSDWSIVSGSPSSSVFSLIVYNNNLIVAAYDEVVPGISYIAQWDGSTWSALGSGVNNYAYSLEIYNNKLIVGGTFTTAGGITVNSIAQWDGANWYAMGTGMDQYQLVRAMYVENNYLFAGGSFTTAGGVTVNKIAKWNGTSWSAMGTGMSGNEVYAINSYNGNLIAGGSFTTAGGVTVNNIAKWRPSTITSASQTLNDLTIKETSTEGVVPVDTLNVAGNLSVSADGADNAIFNAAANDPTINVAGNVDFTGIGGGSESLLMGDGTWTVSGNINFTDGTATANNSILILNGSNQQNITSAGSYLNNLITKNTSVNGARPTDALVVDGYFYLQADVASAVTFDNANNVAVTIAGNLYTNLGIGAGDRNLKLGNGTWQVGNNLDLSLGTLDEGNSTVIMTATSAGKTIESNAQSFNIFELNGLNGGWDLSSILRSISLTLSNGTLTTNDFDLDMGTGLAGGSYSQTNGILNAGASQITCWGNFSVTGGTFNANTSLITLGIRDLGSSTFTGDGYTFNDIAFVKVLGGGVGTINLGSGTLNFTGDFFLSNSSGNLIVSAATNDPDVNIAGDLYSNAGASVETFDMGDGDWNVSGDVNFATATITAAASTLIMDGDATILNGNSRILNNLKISADISISIGSVGVSGILTVDPTQILTIEANRSVAMSNGSTTTLNGEITGLGRFILADSAGANLSAGGTLSAPTRFYASTGDATVAPRTYVGSVEFYSSNVNPRNVILGTVPGQTINFSSDFNLNANGNGNLVVSASANDPQINISGNLDYTGVGLGTESITAGDNTWSISGNVNFSDGSFTREGSSFIMNGSSAQSLTANNVNFNNFTSQNSSAAGLTLNDGFTVFGTFADNTPDTKITFNAGSTYNFTNIDLDGTLGQEIVLVSSTPGASWLLNVTALVPTVSFIDVSDSNASGGSQIIATNYCQNLGNNQNWLFGAAHVTINPVSATINLGETYQFTAQAFDSSWTLLPTATITWSVVAGGGTIDNTGKFTAGNETGIYSNTIQAESNGIINNASVTINESPSLQIPTAQISAPDSAIVGAEVNFSGLTNSTNSPSYFWNFDDSQTGSGKNITHTFSQTGYFDVVLTVTDADNQSKSTSHKITIIPHAPIIIKAEEAEGLEVSVSGTSDPNMTILTTLTSAKSGSKTSANTTSNNDGSWSIKIDLATLSEMKPGWYYFQAIAQDSNKISSDFSNRYDLYLVFINNPEQPAPQKPDTWYDQAYQQISTFLKRNLPNPVQKTIKSMNLPITAVAATLNIIPALASLFISTTPQIAPLFFAVWQEIYRTILNILQILGFRKRRKPWGTVYDSVTKQPISGALVQIFDAVSGRLKEQTSTDISGRFGFLVNSGEYFIKASKNGYNFPSLNISGNLDVGYENLYHGEKINVKYDLGVINANIPLDQKDLAPGAEKKYSLFFTILRFFAKIQLPILILGTLVSLTSFFLERTLFNELTLLFYFALWLFEYLKYRRAKAYGMILDIETKKPIILASVRLFASDQKLLNTCVSDWLGRYRFLVQKGEYNLHADKSGYNPHQEQININYEGEKNSVINNNIKLKKAANISNLDLDSSNSESQNLNQNNINNNRKLDLDIE